MGKGEAWASHPLPVVAMESILHVWPACVFLAPGDPTELAPKGESEDTVPAATKNRDPEPARSVASLSARTFRE